MNAIDTIIETREGYTITINVHADEDMGAPWEEHDGHGIVSDWTRYSPGCGICSKAPGHRVLCEDRGSVRFYDIAATTKLATKDGWGLGSESLAKLEAKLGRKATKREIVAAAVEYDFEYLRRWCADEWHWLGYTTEIRTPGGETIDGDSCCGFDDQKYMTGEALAIARAVVDEHIEQTARETSESFNMACRDVATV